MELLVGLLIGLAVGGAGTWFILQQVLAKEQSLRAASESTGESLRTQVHSVQGNLERVQEELRKEGALRSGAEARLAESQAAEQRLSLVFKSLSNDALAASSKTFLDLASGTLKTVLEEAKGDLGQRQESIKHLVKPLETAIEQSTQLIRELEVKYKQDYGQVHGELTKMFEGTDKLQRVTSDLVAILGNSRVRGQWGQKLAEDFLGKCGLLVGVHFQTELQTAMGRPDFTFLLPEDNRLYMDVKFPIDNYKLYAQAEHPDDQRRYREQFIKDVRQHLRDMERRDYQSTNTIDYLIIFIPNEQVYGFVNEWIPGLIDECLEKKMILCGPWTLYAVIRVIWQAWQNYHYSLAIQDIVKAVKAFEQDFNKFKERFAELGGKLRTAVDKYEEIETVSYKRLDARVRKIDEYQKGRRLPEPQPGDTLPLIDLSEAQP